MHHGMQYDPIQGQGQGLEPFKVRNPAIFNSYSDHFLNLLKSGFDKSSIFCSCIRPTFRFCLTQWSVTEASDLPRRHW